MKAIHKDLDCPQCHSSQPYRSLMPSFLSSSTHSNRIQHTTSRAQDLLFLQAHVARGGALHRVGHDSPLVTYRYHAQAASHAIPRCIILRHCADAIEKAVLSNWPSFTIWGAGRDGRNFFKCLSPAGRSRVVAFCDVDPKKIGIDYIYQEYRVPVVHFLDASRPFVTCVALDRTGGAFEANLASLGLREGIDFYHFC